MKGTGIVPVQSPANVYDKEPLGERVVNFRDYDILGDEWLREILWLAQ